MSAVYWTVEMTRTTAMHMHSSCSGHRRNNYCPDDDVTLIQTMFWYICILEFWCQ